MRSSFFVAALLSVGCGSASLTTGGGTGGGSVTTMDAGAAGGSASGGGQAGAPGGGVAGGRAGGTATGGGLATGGGVVGGGTGGSGGGVVTGGGVAGGGMAGGGAAGGSAGGSAGCSAATCATGCCLNGTCQPGTQPLACGTAGVACAQCMTNEACTGQTCGFDPQSMWRVHPSSAVTNSTKLSGSGWDSFGGDPDPYVDLHCPSSGGITDSTSSVSDTTMPSWSDGECVMTAAELMSSGFAFAVYDADGILGGADDLIAPKTTVRPTSADLMAGTVMRGPVSALTSITFTFSRM